MYFAASIWPLMGTFIYCLDATTGDPLWVNNSTSAQYIKQPHGASVLCRCGSPRDVDHYGRLPTRARRPQRPGGFQSGDGRVSTFPV